MKAGFRKGGVHSTSQIGGCIELLDAEKQTMNGVNRTRSLSNASGTGKQKLKSLSAFALVLMGMVTLKALLVGYEPFDCTSNEILSTINDASPGP